MEDPRKNFCPFDCTETRHHDHGSDGDIYLEPANNVPAEKWEKEFDDKFDEFVEYPINSDAILTPHGLEDIEEMRGEIKHFIRQAISEAVKEEIEFDVVSRNRNNMIMAYNSGLDEAIQIINHNKKNIKP